MLYAKRPTGHWVPAVIHDRTFRCDRKIEIHFAVPPKAIKPPSSSFSSAPPPQSSFASGPRPVQLAPRPTVTCLGFVPHRDITRARPQSARRPKASLRSVRGLSQSLDGFLRAWACRLISFRSHVQGAPVQGVLHSRSPSSSSEEAYPLAVSSSFAHRPKSAATKNDLGSEVFVRVSVRALG